MRFFVLLVIALFIPNLVACRQSTEWTCVAYPDRNNLADALQIGSFPTLQECGIAGVKILDRLGALERGDYECGKNCHKDSSSANFLICEETLKANIPVNLARELYPRDNISQALQKMFIQEIYRTYKPEYLTYLGMLKAWFVRKAISINVPIPKRLTLFVQGQAKFADDVAYLGIVSKSVVPTMEMSPAEFEVYFHGLTKEKSFNLKISKK